jgi:hypothetical protein
LKIAAEDDKMRMNNVADTEQLFRLIQFILSPKAEPFKLWLAQVAAERLDEIQDPELSIDRALEQYSKLGYTESWINQRLKSIEIRKELTDEWKSRGLKYRCQGILLQMNTYELNSISLFINKTKRSFANTCQNEWLDER